VHLEEQLHSGVVVWKIVGSLDAVAEDEMLAKVDDLLVRGHTRVVVDLSRLKLIDSSGIGSLVSLLKRVRAVRGDVKVAGIGGQPATIFKLLKLDSAFQCSASVEEALDRFEALGG
jgi:anti-sigma B factor antagonist